MPLPKLDTPVHTLELPSTGEEIKFRPFLIKEQKLLMMAQESEDDKQIFETMKNIIHSCTFEKVDTTNAPLFDVEYIFLKLRAKSVGENAKIKVLCPDDEETHAEVSVDLDKIDVQMTEGHTNIVQLNDKIKLVMKYPQLVDMKDIEVNTNNVDSIFIILKHCIWEVHDGDTIYNRVDISDKDIVDFIESFDTSQFERVMEFFNSMPKLRHVFKVKNPKTKVESDITLEGLQSFLG